MRLGAIVFIAGAATLAVEICASRLLAPFFGNSTVVWANVIGLILVYLSIGYWFGGQARRPAPGAARARARSCSSRPLAIAVIPFVARPFLDATVQRARHARRVGAVVGSFFAALALFAVPVTLLGIVSPFAIRLALPSVENAGAVSGRLYGLSTIGSILGTFAAAIVAIPFVGTQRTLIGTAVAARARGRACCSGARWQLLTLALAALLAVPPGAIKSAHGVLYEARVALPVHRRARARRRRARARAERRRRRELALVSRTACLTGGEWDMFLVVPPLVPHPVRRVARARQRGRLDRARSRRSLPRRADRRRRARSRR